MEINNNSLYAGTIPQQVEGTITIASGEVIHINSQAVASNASIKSPQSFVQELKKAIRKKVFKKDNESETNK